MKLNTGKRLLSWFLSAALMAGLAVPVRAAGAPSGSTVSFRKVDNSEVSASLLHHPAEEPAPAAQTYAEHDSVRVSIVLEEDSTLEAGFDTEDIAENPRAMAYRADLLSDQTDLVDRIESSICDDVDVVWNLTLAANIISANVEYGQIDAISRVPGVEKVVVERTYKPLEAVTSAEAKPNMVISAGMTGARDVWDSGCYGAGTRIAVIDTGLDTDHQSFDPAALEYAYQQSAEAAGLSYEDYVDSLDLLDTEEIAAKLDQLNLKKLMPDVTAEQLYVNLKAPFGVNYIDRNFSITHDNDSASEHGSHVSGIAAANRFIRQGDSFVSAADTVYTLGNAPDAQIIVMKVFGEDSPTDADYMAALEDAIVLGCDVANLSLGGSDPGGTISLDYQDIMDSLVNTDTVVAIAAGNEGPWSAHASGPVHNLYVEDVGMQTASEPSTFTNSLSVASVDNNGLVSPSILFQGRHFGYLEGKGDFHDPLPSLDKTGTGTAYDYVVLNSEGRPEDYEGIDVTGKLVLVSRGDINFTDKAKAAVDKGAVATLIYNNVEEPVNMVLEGYWESEPCVLISRDTAEAIKAGSEARTTDKGVTYYVGRAKADGQTEKLTISGQFYPNESGLSYHTMSAFSSWGVPGDLSMKPEISAPGGNIYSVNGAVPETDQYEVMSGTSMATPQVAGLTALLMERIHNSKLSQPGMTDRALAQSLLMSTADPMHDANGDYIPILQQGAGLANIRDAITANAFATVTGQPDGKAKVELGDDPARTGSYDFSFEIHNLTDEPQRYELSADLFTQDTFEDYANQKAMDSKDQSQLATYLSFSTLDLDSTARWTANGQTVKQSIRGLEGCDFNGNGVVTALDAQALLDYVVGLTDSIHNADQADLDHDGQLTTYDVHLFLKTLDSGTITVPANSTVTVSASLSLTEDAKAMLDSTYPNGAYMQAYVYADGLPTDEGVDGTHLSIPVLGFYGNWTDPSMFELGSTQSKLSGEELRTTYTGEGEAIDGNAPSSYNTLEVEYYRDPGYSYLLGGNPVDPEERPDPERTAINNQNGDKLHSFKFSPIRNAASSRVQITDSEGNVLWQRYPGPYGGAYYGIVMFMQMWINSNYRYPINFVPRSLAEGESFTASITLAPEYNTDMAEDKADWASLGRGATLSTSVTIDNTAPEIVDVAISDDAVPTITVQASDNQYVAGVALFDRSGRNVLSSCGSIADAQPGDVDQFVLSTQKANGKKFLVQVFDYAYNVSTYELVMDLGKPVPLPYLLAHDLEYADYGPGYWTGFGLDATYRDLSTYAKSPVTMYAAAMSDPYLYAYAGDGALYAIHKEDLLSPVRVGLLTHALDDMACDPASGLLYAVYQDEAGSSTLCTVDPLTGALTDVGALPLKTNTLAITPDGAFYCNELETSKVYRYTLDTLAEPVLVAECLGDGDVPFPARGTQSMAYDPNTGNVVWISFTSTPSSWGGTDDNAYLYEIKPDGSVVRHSDLLHHLVALVIPDQTRNDPDLEPTDTVTGMSLTDEEVFLMKSQEYQLTADVLPWNASDRFVFWESDDPQVVSVDGKGLLTAEGVGTATVTATSRLDPSFTDTVTVHVNDIKITAKGILQDSSGKPSTFSWDLEKANDWTADLDLDTDVMAATAKDDWTYYVTSGTGRTMKKIDFGVSETVSTWTRPVNDLAYSPVFSGEKDLVHMTYMTLWLPAKDLNAVPEGSGWDLASLLEENNGGVEFLALASGGAVRYTETNGVTHNAEVLYFVDDLGGILKLYAYLDSPEYNPDYDPEYPYNAGAEYFTSDLLAAGYTVTYDNNDNPLSSLVVGDDGNLYFAGFNGNGSELYQLVFNQETQSYEAARFADMGEGVWPVSLTGVTANPEPESPPPAPFAAVSAPISTLARKAVLDEEDEANGSLLAVRSQDTAPQADGKDLLVPVAYDVPSTNGLLTVAYDPAALELKAVTGHADFNAQRVDAGTVTFGYAGASAIPAKAPVLTLTFAPRTDALSTITVTTTERNQEHLSLVETIPVGVQRPAPAAPVINPDGQRFRTQVDVYLSAEDGADLYYTTDGTTPTVESTPYTGYFTLDCTTTVKAIAVRDGVVSEVASAVFTRTHEGSGSGGGTIVPPPKPVEPPLRPSSFTDVKDGDYFAEAVRWAVEQGITAGTSQNTFAPLADCTRAQMVTFLWRSAGSPRSTADVQFADVPAGAYYAEAVRWAVEQGITAGTSANTFSPELVCTRAQAVALLWRMAGSPEAAPSSFADVSADAYYASAVAWAVEQGITAGTSSTTFSPEAPCTRSQIVTLLYRANAR